MEVQDLVEVLVQEVLVDQQDMLVFLVKVVKVVIKDMVDIMVIKDLRGMQVQVRLVEDGTIQQEH